MAGERRGDWTLVLSALAFALSVLGGTVLAQPAPPQAKVRQFEAAFARSLSELRHPENWIAIRPVNGAATLCVVVHDPRRQRWQSSASLWQRWLNASPRNREWQNTICPGYTGETMFQYLEQDCRVRTAYNSAGRAVFRGVQSIFGASDAYQGVRVTIIYPRINQQRYHFRLPNDALNLVASGDPLNQAMIDRMQITINDHPVTMDTYNGPMIDCHTHFNGLFGGRRQGTPEAQPAVILRRMGLAGVERIVLMTNRACMQAQVAFARNSRGRVLAFADFSNHQGQSGHALNVDDFVRGLQGRAYAGLGVLYARNNHYLRLPPNSPGHMRLYALAARLRLPVAVHTEIVPNAPEWYRRSIGRPVPALSEEWADALRRNPETRFIWLSCGDSTPAIVRRFLRAHRNLYCELSRTPLDWTLPLPEEWRNAMNAFPRRFLFGSGAKTTADYEGEAHYELVVERYRRVLSCLQPATARRIAYDNAVQFLNLQPLPQERRGARER